MKRRHTPRSYRMESKEQTNDFLWTVKDDIEFLSKMNFASPSRSSVRVSASILRRLLVDEMYPAAWQFSGLTSRPTVEAFDLGSAVARIESRHIHYAYAGGAPTEGAQHTGYILLAIPKEEVDAANAEAQVQKIRSLLSLPKRKVFIIDDFCSSPSVICGNDAVSRSGIIRYVANKLGGVHWDNARGAWTDPVAGRQRLLDENHMMVGRLSAPLYEAVSIAYDLSTSNDAKRLCQQINEIAPEPQLSECVLKFREGRTGAYADMTFPSRNQPA